MMNLSPVMQSENKPRSGTPFRYVLIFGVLYLVWLLSNHAGARVRCIVSDSILMFTTILAFAWSMHGARKQKAGALSLNLMGVSFAVGLTGWLFWSYREIIHGEKPPFPSLTDAAFIGYYVFMMAGLLLLPGRVQNAAARVRIFLDSLMVVAALITFSWYFLLGPTLMDSAATPLAKFVGAFYPLADIALIACLLVVVSRSTHSNQHRARMVLVIGMLCYTFADTAYAYLTLQGTYATGHWSDVGTPLGNLLTGLGICALRKTLAVPCDKSQSTSRLALWQSLLPYGLLPLVLWLVLHTNAIKQGGHLENGVNVGAATLIGLLLLRQILAIFENQRLNQSLQASHQQVTTYALSLGEANEELQAIHEELLASNQELSNANAKLEALATTDAMTSLPNHRTFQERLGQELSIATRHNRPCCLLFLDVDCFKQYNDSFGHLAGDEALRIVARLLKENVRAHDMPARYGGEEFAVLLPETALENAVSIAERIRTALEAFPFPHRQVTLSIGVTQFDVQSDSPTEFLARADEALYAAKHGGRNQVVSAAQPLQNAA